MGEAVDEGGRLVSSVILTPEQLAPMKEAYADCVNLYWVDKHYSAGKWYPGPRPELWPVPQETRSES